MRENQDLPGPDDVVRLTPEGRMFYENLLDVLSTEAGRRITGDDVSLIMARVKAELGLKELFFKDPGVTECFIKHLRLLGSQ